MKKFSLLEPEIYIEDNDVSLMVAAVPASEFLVNFFREIFRLVYKISKTIILNCAEHLLNKKGKAALPV